MTADNTNETNGQSPEQGGQAKTRGRKASLKRTASRGQASKRGTTAASRRSSNHGGAQSEQANSSRSSGRSGRSGRGSSGGSSGGGIVRAIGRAIPLAARGFADQRMVQRLVDDRPYVLGAIGLGIGAMIGLMLPATWSSMAGHTRRGRSSR